MPSEILPHLFLGNADDAVHASINVKLIVNCTKNLPFYSPDMQQIRIDVDDNGYDTDKIIKYWTCELFEAISNHILQGHDVLIHCQMGRQRSASTVVAYIMKTLKWPLEKTIEHVKSKRREAFFPEINFITALEEYSHGCK